MLVRDADDLLKSCLYKCHIVPFITETSLYKVDDIHSLIIFLTSNQVTFDVIPRSKMRDAAYVEYSEIVHKM